MIGKSRQLATRGTSLAALTLSLFVLSASPALAERPTGKSTAAEGAAAPGVVNINTATASEFERLPGVGPSRAEAILKLRTQVKRFSRVEELMRVKGIGRATFRKLRPMLVLDGPTTLAAKTGRTSLRSAPSSE